MATVLPGMPCRGLSKVSLALVATRTSLLLTHWGSETGIMLQILHTISPLHLRILHLRFPSAPKPFTLIPTPFPALVDLRIEGLLNSLELFSHSPICPTLKRLYIGPYVQVPERFGEALERVCPNLTHLRIQSPEQETGKHHLLQFVHAYCKRHEPLSTIIYSQDSEDSRRPENDESVPPSLCRIIIEFYAFVDYDETVCTPGWHRFYEPLEEYYKLTAAESNVLDDDEVSSERTLLLLPTPGGPHGPAEREQYLTQKLRIAEKEWLERTSGTGPGCWMPARVAGIGPILWMGDFQVSV